jgi:purine-binding chemotaxis protein CheW
MTAVHVHVRVRVAGEQYALPVEHVAEVVELGQVTPVPGAPRPLLGLQNLRGEIVSVVDLATALGLHGETRPSRLIVATDGARRAGFAIDEVLSVGSLPETAPEQGLGCVSSTTVVDGVLTGIVDIGVLFDAIAGTPA